MLAQDQQVYGFVPLLKVEVLNECLRDPVPWVKKLPVAFDSPSATDVPIGDAKGLAQEHINCKNRAQCGPAGGHKAVSDQADTILYSVTSQAKNSVIVQYSMTVAAFSSRLICISFLFELFSHLSKHNCGIIF